MRETMREIIKYPRTPHLDGSRLQRGDEDLTIISSGDLRGRYLVIEEKLDGANSAISFDADGTLFLQCRGHVLSGGPRERQFDLFKRWANARRTELWNVLGARYILYGEWLYARHTIPYDQLPHFFQEFDILDREADEFLSTERRRALLADAPVVSVPILAWGVRDRLDDLIGPSRCAANETMEGLYIKWEQDGRVCGRYKYVRASFTQAVEEEGEHWMDRPIEPNQLKAGVDIFATYSTKERTV
jgi:hypothetical protein